MLQVGATIATTISGIIIIIVLSLAVGAVLGEMARLEERLDAFGIWLTELVGDRFGDIGKGFVTASLVYCIGAMAIVGSLQEGLTGDASIIYADYYYYEALLRLRRLQQGRPVLGIG